MLWATLLRVGAYLEDNFKHSMFWFYFDSEEIKTMIVIEKPEAWSKVRKNYKTLFRINAIPFINIFYFHLK